MDILEIGLLVGGVLLIILGFVIPAKKEEVSEQTKELAKEEIASLVSQEMEKVKGHVDDVVQEAVGYAVEKTERSLERISNEKIMAVSEYSDTVMQDIHKNHEEVLFLYDMLNDKHTNLKNTVSEVNKTVKEVEQTKQEAEAVVYSFLQMNQDARSDSEQHDVTAVKTDSDVTPPVQNVTQQPADKQMEISFTESVEEPGTNSNERILELFRQGKSKVAIAKELGLGVGEVKLVIDLYKNLNN
ncbi:MAG: hypothetical protein IJ801_05170 [Lachnospiraceae bacterium]|nr:hypothetical protein [Lachnospiraceae bacterium]